jgi:hypothetical protein
VRAAARGPPLAMATLAELRSDLRIWTSTHANVNVLPDGVCDECINAAISLMQEAHLWRGQETTSVTLTYPAAVESIGLPPDFVSQKAVYQWVDSQQFPLAYIEKTRRDDFIRADSPMGGIRDPEYPQVSPPNVAALGTNYAIWMERLYLYPPPQSTDITLIVDYWKRLPPLFAVDGTNFFTTRYPHVVRYGALADAYCYLHEEERGGVYRQMFESMLARVILDDKTLMLAGGSTSRGV